jgi:hypothetical protein
MIAVPWERTRIFDFESREAFERAAYNVAGIIKEAEATAINEDIVDATV